MDTSAITTVAAIIGAAVALTGLVVTVLLLLSRGFFRLGQFFQRMDDQDENIRQLREEMRQSNAELREEIRQSNAELREEIRQSNAELREEMRQSNAELRADIQQLTAEIRQTNEVVIALANHRHDQDGNIVFILPVQPGG